jgi:aryl-alcohol dehydrogenase-like predicted oxidoreductase
LLLTPGVHFMPIPSSGRFMLAGDMNICRLLNGMWQVSGTHGRIDPTQAVEAMFAYHDAGFTTWDLADHYGPAEKFIAAFRRRFAGERGAERLGEIQAFTKWVPYPMAITRGVVEDAVRLSLETMEVDCLDLLQFHWWDYSDSGYLDALKHLADLQAEGKIRHLALTNFDTERMLIIAEAGIRIASNQVQYSLIDRRPERQMAAFCEEQGISLLSYGTVLGGLLSEKWLGRPEPGRFDLDTASLQKYKNMIDAWGGWALYQDLLAVLKRIADKHGVSIANLGCAYVLARPVVAGVIIGARLGLTEHIADNARIFGLTLHTDDLAEIESVLENGEDLLRAIGDCGDEYR